MAVFSTNQVRHLYVAKAVNSNLQTTGDVKFGKIEDEIYLKHVGAAGVTRSDLIKTSNIKSVTVTTAEKMARVLKQVKVTLDPAVNGGKPVAGQDYILTVLLKQYIGLSDDDQFAKYGAVHAVTGMTASDFYVKMALSLRDNFKREPAKSLTIHLATSSGMTELTDTTKAADLGDTYVGVVLKEAVQDWVLGVKAQKEVIFEVSGDKITYNLDEVEWAVCKNVTPTKDSAAPADLVTNGKKIADLEYFCMGDRADYYRGVGFPHIIRTTYLVDPTKEYDVINIHYFYEGAGECSAKSEKDLTIVCPADETQTVATAVMADFNAVRGTAAVPPSKG